MKSSTQVWTLDALILAGKIKLGRGNIISKKDIASFPGEFPIYSSAREKNGTFGFYGKYMFDEELITWSIDGGGHLFYRPRHKFSVTNVGGTLRILDTDFLDCRYLYFVLSHLHSKIRFDWVYKAHPSVIRMVYNEIPIPSLEKQFEIVEKLESHFAQIDLLVDNLFLLDEKVTQLQQSLLSASFAHSALKAELINRSVDRELDVKVVKLSELFRVGSSKRVLKADWKENGVPFYRGREITRLSKTGAVDNELFISEEHFKDLSTTYGVPNAGDIMVTAIGTIGNAYVVKEHDRFYFKDASVLWLHKQAPVDSQFIEYWLKSDLFFDQLDKGNGATVDTLTIEKLSNVKISLPSMAKQHEMVAKLDNVFSELELLKLQFKMKNDFAVALRQSLLSNAFTEIEAVA